MPMVADVEIPRGHERCVDRTETLLPMVGTIVRAR